MSALSHIRDYLKEKFAAHDIDTLMDHFETAIEAKVEESTADLKQEIAELRNDLTGDGRAAEPSAEPGYTTDVGPSPFLAPAIEQLPPIAQPDAKVEAQSSDVAADGSVA